MSAIPASTPSEKQQGQLAITLVRFVPSPQPGDRLVMTFADPAPCCAVASSLSEESLDKPPAAASPAELRIVFIPPSLTPDARRRRYETWIRSPASPDDAPPLRIVIDRGAIVYRSGRALVQAPSHRADALLQALVDFAFYDNQLRQLEREVASDWHIAEGDIPLVHDVRASDLKRAKDVGAITRQTLLRRIRCSRIESRLLNPPDCLPPAARRAARRLRGRARFEQRLETLDGQLETCEYLYEMANQRLGEYTNFRREYLIEILIVVLLGAELLMMFVDFYFNFIAE